MQTRVFREIAHVFLFQLHASNVLRNRWLLRAVCSIESSRQWAKDVWSGLGNLALHYCDVHFNRWRLRQSLWSLSHASVMSNMQPAFGDRASASDTERRIDAIAWAVFFIWIGIVMLMEVPWGWFLVGVGVLTLAAQLWTTRLTAFGLHAAWFFSQGACGCFFTYSGR
jgi:hypothetical protein